MSSKIPPLLEPYLALPPEASLILLTSVLGASSNWLTLRFLHRALLSPDIPEASENDTKVVLVSFMRDLAFWKDNGKRMGIDLDKLAVKKRFVFIDGLNGLFFPTPQKNSLEKGGGKVLSSPNVKSASEEMRYAIEGLKVGSGDSENVLLIIDQLDLLLAAGGPQVTADALGDMLMDLREDVHATIMTISADLPLVANTQKPLESSHAALLLSLAHQADFTMSLRLLDSGTARDVSGVIRITAGDEGSGDMDGQKLAETELLYFVGGDGGVSVFERGR